MRMPCKRYNYDSVIDSCKLAGSGRVGPGAAVWKLGAIANGESSAELQLN